jgi:DNA repair photolyase
MLQLLEAKSIFSPAIGFIRRGGFDWTCNPYLGCTFGCSYCYAMFLPQNRRPKEDWGKWFAAKRNAVELAQRQARKLAGQAVYMASVTDPYQPVERSLKLTRGILEALAPHEPRLVVQTRGPLVVRDIDVLTRFAKVRVNVSIPTDSEAVRKLFEPKSPPLEARWAALDQLRAARIPVAICVTPTLPIEDLDGFARRLIGFRPEVLVCQDFHDAGGRFGADTRPVVRQLVAEMNWTEERYREFVKRVQREMTAYEGEAGFCPP